MVNNHHKNYNLARDYMQTACRNNNKGNHILPPWQFLSDTGNLQTLNHTYGS